MTGFLHQDFLLDTATARRLFHEVARYLPIVDYHNHLPPAEIASDRTWENLGEMWLAHDHYKWRVMRWAGIDEARVTGDATWREKFDAFAEAMPRAVLNPVHHWSHLELWRYFDLNGTVLSPISADNVWDAANAQLGEKGYSAQSLLRKMKVELVGTTDDPLDTLEHHAAMGIKRVICCADELLLALAQQLLLRILAPDLDELEVVIQTFSHFITSQQRP